MPEWLLSEKSITLLVLGLAVLSFAREWIPLGFTALLAALALVLTGILPAATVWPNFASDVVVCVGAMFVLSGALSRTRALAFLGDVFLRQARRGRKRFLGLLMLVVAMLSAFVNNTTIVLVFLPIVIRTCERIEQAPSRYLIPLSYASIFGGMMTLIGTSTNVLVADVGPRALVKLGVQEEVALGMWSFAPVGLCFVIVGTFYMVTLGRRLLPDRVALSMALQTGTVTEYVTEIEIPENSPLVGRKLSELMARYEGLRVLQLIRRGAIEAPDPEARFEAGDLLLVKAAAGRILELGNRAQARILPDVEKDDVKTRAVDLTLAEVIVPPRSRWVGRRVADIGFRPRYGVAVIAVQRQGHHIRQKVAELIVEPADMLLVQGTPESLRNLRSSDNLILIEGVDRQVRPLEKAPWALLGLGIFVWAVSMGWADPATGAVLGAAVIVLSRCMTFAEAFASVDWNVLFVLGGSLAIGQAAEHTGLARDAAEILLHLGRQPHVLLLAAYLLTTVLTDTISNGSAAALMLPVAARVALEAGHSPEPYFMAVAFGASAAFLSPVGYQTNLLVYNPGGYRFRDFLVVGLPLRFLFAGLAVVVIPFFHPFS